MITDAYKTCSLELSALARDEVCGACGDLTQEHKSWAGNRNVFVPSALGPVSSLELLASGAKYDHGKVRPSLFPWGAFRSLLDVMEYGARKYAAHSWMNVENAEERYTEALHRHFIDLAEGKERDEESGCYTLAHIAINCCFLIVFKLRKAAGFSSGSGSVVAP